MADERIASTEPTALVHVSTPSVIFSRKMTILTSERSEPLTMGSNRHTLASAAPTGPTNLLSEFIRQLQDLRCHKCVPCALIAREHTLIHHLQEWKACGPGRSVVDRGRRCRSRPLWGLRHAERRAEDPGAHGQVAQCSRRQGTSKQERVWCEHRSRRKWYVFTFHNCLPVRAASDVATFMHLLTSTYAMFRRCVRNRSRHTDE